METGFLRGVRWFPEQIHLATWRQCYSVDVIYVRRHCTHTCHHLEYPRVLDLFTIVVTVKIEMITSYDVSFLARKSDLGSTHKVVQIRS
jgi:hypothetical protein